MALKGASISKFYVGNYLYYLTNVGVRWDTENCLKNEAMVFNNSKVLGHLIENVFESLSI